jgi:S-DNA-T family DNA segregation ATPase FtsK/SpoIIIE
MFHKKRNYKKRGPFKMMKLKKQTVYTVAAIWLWLFSAIILLSFFTDAKMLSPLREELYGSLGWAMYPLPPLLVSISLLFFKIKSEIAKPNVPIGLSIMLLGLIGVTQAGSVGEDMWVIVANAIAAEGSVLAFLGLVIVGFIVTFNASLDAMVDLLLKVLAYIGESIGKMFEKKPSFAGLSEKPKLMIKGEEEEKPPLKIGSPAVPATSPKPGPTAAQKEQLKVNNPMANDPNDTTMWEYPPETLLSDGPKEKADRGDVRKNADTIEKTLESFGIRANVVEVNPGPAVTQYALKITLGTKVSKITSLSSDLALALAAPTGQVRIEAPIPGRDLVGIEIPNRGLEFVTLKRMLSFDILKHAKNKLTVALGLDVSGKPVVADIAKMPHVLVAGATNSGKSVLMNTLICSLLYKTTPKEVRLILIDPKRVELTGYNGIPHLLTPVIVEQDKILSALHWAINEMENRYKKFAEIGVRNIDGFNEWSGFQALPYVVICIDELAEIMAYAPADVEDSICRLAQMARAVGIHLVVATQRPSVDVITGLIKANIPCRISFNVTSMMDSRVIIDMPGAEKLLGRGDMLFIPPDQSKPSRIQGTYVSEGEVGKIVEFLRSKNVTAQYTEEVINTPVVVSKKGSVSTSGESGKDPLFEDSIRLICQYDKASASLLQRRLSVGYARAARILDQLEEAGIIGAGEGAKPRDVLVKNAEEYIAGLHAPQE